MMRRTWINAFALSLAFVLGTAFTYRPSPVEAQVLGGHGKCVGVATGQRAIGVNAVYRAFEDGTVEMVVDAAGGQPDNWKSIGR
jgi:hypothetical protein